MNKPYDTYNGGKSGAGVYQAIINEIPPHKIFISGFAGNCSILANKLPASMANIAIDADAAVINAWNDIPGIIALNQDAAGFIPGLISSYPADLIKDVFVFLDPPYLMEVRAGKQPYYKNEMGDHASHEKLLRALVELPCMVAITHYPCKLYDDALSSWRKLDFNGRTRRGMRTERIYMNYASPDQLHDYRYFGNDFRERELYRKMKCNMVSKFKTMSAVERNFILDALRRDHII